MNPRTFLDGKVTLYGGDNREVLKTLADASIDSIVTDPPYALVSIGKRFGKAGSAEAKSDGATGVYKRASAGFMGQQWDTGETAFAVEFWEECFRILKPGGHCVAFSGTRTYHRMVCAIEDAGFEIRDQLAWVYGNGFPKSHNVSKAIDREAGATREIISSRRAHDIRGGNYMGASQGKAIDAYTIDITAPATPAAQEWQGWETALKPSWEPIVLARRPLIGTVAQNVLAHGAGGLNIDGCRIGESGGTAKGRSAVKSTTDSVGGYLNAKAGSPIDAGRWPANIIHDGSAEVVELFPNSKSCSAPSSADSPGAILGGSRTQGAIYPGEDGSAARFFYSAKANTDERAGSKHPTIKPVDLMQWLARLVTPPGGVTLDPFAGSGTTGEAAWREGFSAILIERETKFQEDIARRMDLATAGPATRAAEISKARGLVDDAGPLFANDNGPASQPASQPKRRIGPIGLKY